MADENGKKAEAQQAEKREPKDNVVSTQHTVTVGGRELSYTATAGTMVLREEDDKEGHKAKAEMFFIAYTLNGVEDAHARPITFSFNGGPGSSSVWLHLGVLGPRRVPLSKDGVAAVRPPYRLVDNEYTLLEESDLVFIDPVGTGYSRMVAGEKVDPNEFHTFQRDIESVGEFIRLYTTRTRRWSSPKFLIGESYGTTRATGLSDFLQERYGMYFNGIMLISAILNFQTARFEVGNDLPPTLFLPTYAATAWYHDKLEAKYQDMPLPQFLDEVEEFAATDYTLALMQGAKLSGVERARIVERLAAYTGLGWKYIEQTNLRINIHRFVKELLRDEGLTVGRLDSRFKGRDRDDVGEGHEYDPSYAATLGTYAACLNDLVRSELQFESDVPYEILSFKVFPKWKYDTHENQYVNTAETLRTAMTKNPHLKIFVGNGYYDLATPYFATEYTFNHLGLRGELLNNITMAYYEAGHMMYVHPPSLAKMKADLAQFMAAALPSDEGS